MTTTADNLRNAATVILTRDGSEGMEVFLMRRHRAQSFMGGAFVFPGGAIDEDDVDSDLLSSIVGMTATEAVRDLQEPDLPASMACGLYMAAIRETFEEAGVLLAYAEDGKPLQYPDTETAARLSHARQALHKREMSLKDLARQEKIHFALDLLTPYAHWITPSFEKKRFNTRFFLARMPAGQVPLHDTIEMTESRWMTPSEALAAHRRREIQLMPPTLRTLEDISRFDETGTLFQSAKKRKLFPILPQGYRIDGTFHLLLPHDPDYSLDGYKQPSRQGEPSRLVLIDERWQTVTPSA